MNLEAFVAIMALTGACLVIARKPKYQLIGLHLFLVCVTVGGIFFALIHLWYMMGMCMGGLVVCAKGITVRLPNK